jgi:hypothetical protein
MAQRDFSDPESMAGATAEEVAAMKPEGWLVRPFPDRRRGFQMLDPWMPPGAVGSISYHFGTPGYRTFSTRPPTPIFILNEALEMPSLGTLAREYADAVDGSEADAGISSLIPFSIGLLRARLIRLWEDTLGCEEAVLLDRSRGVKALEDTSNWLSRDTQSPTRAQSALFLDVTRKGRKVLRELDRKPLKLAGRSME